VTAPDEIEPPAAAAGPLALLEMIHAGFMSQAVYAAARLGIAEALAEGPRTAAELAPAVGAHADSLRRLLRALAALGVCDEREPGSFALTPLGRHLRADDPASVRSMALHWGGSMWPIWGTLLHSVKTGVSPRGLVTRKASFDSLAQSTAAQAVFDEAMTEMSRLVAGGVVRAHDFSGVARVVDVGGGHGELIGAVLEAHPAMRGALLDLPHVLDGARPRLAALGVAGRCDLVPGSFFDAVPGGGDVYMLKSVLHDWDDDRAREIAAHCRRAMPGHARLLVVERVLPERMGPSAADRSMAASDLGMMVAVAGRERTAAEFRALLGSAGFAVTRITPAAMHVSVIEAAPA
jgi:hypothetical protein